MLLLLLACDPSPAPLGCVRTVTGASVRQEGACPTLLLTGEIIGEGDLSLTFTTDGDAIVPTVSGSGTLRAVVLSGGLGIAGDGPLRLWRQGYQSWSWSGVVDVTTPELDADGLPIIGGDGDTFSVIEETPWTSWWAGLVGRPGGESALIGFLSATRTKSWLGVGPEQVWVVWGGRGEQLPVDGDLSLDPLWLGYGADPNALWAEWAQAVVARTPPPALGTQPPVGWSDWYTWYGTTTEEEIRANLAVAATLPGMEVFQVDDGWEPEWGIWTANERFPSGMATLAADIAATGQRPGLWMAPFYVARSAEVWAANPDWWVKDENGEELGTTNCDCAVIDVTHPDAAAWLQEQIRVRVEEGWTYLKLDFLYAGAQEGVRQAPVTGTEAFQQGLALIREAAGESAWILGCGAPLLSGVGTYHSWRSGADIAFIVAPDPTLGAVRWQARSTAARAFLNGVFWWNDQDNLVLRGELEPSGMLAAQVASGGAWLLGDDLTTLDTDRLNLAITPELLALRGQTGVPTDPLDFPGGVDGSPLLEQATPDDQVPTRWTLPGGETILLNLSEQEITLDGPGGAELISGQTAAAGARTLAPGQGEVWR